MIRIVDSLWNVVYVSPYDSVLLKNGTKYTLGCCDNNVRTIYIACNLSKCENKIVLVHELTHAFMFELWINIPYEQEERVCNLVAEYGEDIFDIVDMLSEEIEKAMA